METNRRNLVGCALAFPIIAIPAVADAAVPVPTAAYARSSSGSGAWWRVHARMTRLELAVGQVATDAAELPDGADRSEAYKRAERLSVAAYQLRWRLLTTPAPDVNAALWKFDYLFEPADGETPAWNVEHENVRLAFSDVRRCLGGRA